MRLRFYASRANANTALIAVTAVAGGSCCIHQNRWAPAVFTGFSLRQQSLDVVQLHKALLEGVLGLSRSRFAIRKTLTNLRDTGEAIARCAERRERDLPENPCRMDQARDIAFAVKCLPQKSTDFFSEMLDGLTIYAVD